MRCSEPLRASRWLPPAIPPPAPILTLTAFARNQSALRSAIAELEVVRRHSHFP